MASGSGTSVLGEQQLFSGALSDTQFLIRLVSGVPADDSRLGLILVSLGYSGSRYLWRAFPLHRNGRIITGIPASPNTGKTFVVRWNTPGIGHQWVTLA